MAETKTIDVSFEEVAERFEDYNALIGQKIPSREKLTLLEQVADEQDRLQENPNRKLATIQAILNDQYPTIENADEKLTALKGVLDGQFRPLPENDPQKSFSDPEEKLDEIDTIVRDKNERYSHPHEKFASIEAILGDHSNSSNPWVLAHKSLAHVEESSYKIIKAEEKRQKELRELWKTGMDDKAKLYPEMARDQKWWQNISMVFMGASLVAPFAGRTIGKFVAENFAAPVVKYFSNIDIQDLTSLIENGCQRIPDLVNNMGNQFIQVSSQMSSLAKKDRETFHDWETQQERQDLETQQQLVQEARQNDNSLKERHLEVIRTLTSMIVGR